MLLLPRTSAPSSDTKRKLQYISMAAILVLRNINCYDEQIKVLKSTYFNLLYKCIGYLMSCIETSKYHPFPHILETTHFSPSCLRNIFYRVDSYPKRFLKEELLSHFQSLTFNQCSWHNSVCWHNGFSSIISFLRFL